MVADIELQGAHRPHRVPDLLNGVAIGLRALQEATIAAEDFLAGITAQATERVIDEHARIVRQSRIGDDHRHSGSTDRCHERIRAVVVTTNFSSEPNFVGLCLGFRQIDRRISHEQPPCVPHGLERRVVPLGDPIDSKTPVPAAWAGGASSPA